MTVVLLILLALTFVCSVFALKVALVTMERVDNVDRYLHQRGLRMCYRDAEDLKTRYSK